MLKSGRYRAFRNLPVGWLLQAIHSTDVSECLFRIFVELCSFVFFYWSLTQQVFTIDFVAGIASFFIVHTINWFLTGNFWLYMLDSFHFIKNPGLGKTISFLQITRKLFTTIECSDSILIYGSMCRAKFHERSDVDLRVLRRRDTFFGLVALPVGLALRIYSFLIRLPLDLQVVDSMEFLRRQMHPNERPILLYSRTGYTLSTPSKPFSEIENRPESILDCNSTLNLV